MSINRIVAGAGLGALFAVVLGFTAIAIGASWGGAYFLFDFVAGATVCVIALLRRRHPVRAAVAGIGVALVVVVVAEIARLPQEPGPAAVLGLAVLVGSVIRTLPVRPAGGVAAAGFAVVAGAWFTGGVTSVPVLAALGWFAAVAGGAWLRLLDDRRRAAVEGIRRAERLDLARELHDVVAHHITGIVVQAQAAQIVAGRHPERVTGSLADIEAAGAEALSAMRRVVGLLRDTEDAPSSSPAPERLSELVRRFDGQQFGGRGPAVRLRLPDGEPVWPPEVTSTVYRVVQESLTNISRHAPQARSVTVSVVQDRRAVTVEVVDDGPPGPARSPHRGGYGLTGMRERVDTLGGTLEAGPRPGAGWSVLATLPLPQ